MAQVYINNTHLKNNIIITDHLNIKNIIIIIVFLYLGVYF